MPSIRWGWSSESAEHAPELARARQRPHQQVGVVTPRGIGELDPVPLDLLAGWVVDLDGGPALHPRTRLTVRAQAPGPDPPGEALVAEGEPQGHHLVIEGGRPHVRVVFEAQLQVGDELVEGIGTRPPTFPGNPFPVRWSRIVRLSRPRCRAMAEIDHPCLRSAFASTSSSPVNMESASSWACGLDTTSLRRGPPSVVDPQVTRDSQVGNFDEQVWGEFNERGHLYSSS